MVAGCVFCSIVRGDSPANIVMEWPDVIAFTPLNPVVEGHTLIVPKVHVADFTSDPGISGNTMAAAAVLAQLLRGSDYNIITSKGVKATQSVFHLHLHLIPRKGNDRLALPWHSGKNH